MSPVIEHLLALSYFQDICWLREDYIKEDAVTKPKIRPKMSIHVTYIRLHIIPNPQAITEREDG